MKELSKVEEKLNRLEEIFQNYPAYPINRLNTAKSYVSKAIVELKRDNLLKALEYVELAEKSAIEEIEIVNELKKFEPLDGRSKSIVKEVVKSVESGDFDKARSKLEELRKSISDWERLLSKVEEVEKLIEKRLPASKPDEAEKIKEEALSKIKSGEFEEAERLLKEAEILAKPTPDYILQSAKEIFERAKENFETKNYDEAIRLWKKSSEEYERAKTLALERGDNETVEAIDRVIETINQNVEKAEISRDWKMMADAIEEGKEFVKDGNSLLESSQFDRARESYEKGLERYMFALEIAERRGFEEAEKLKNAIESVKVSIKSCIFGKGRLMIENAIKMDPVESEREFRRILSWLEEQNIDKERLNELKALALDGLITAMIKKAEMEMQDAEKLFDEGRYYEAKEKYRSIWSYLNEVSDEATNLKVLSKIDYINRLIDACNRNVTRATNMMFKVEGVDVEIERIKDIEVGIEKISPEELTPVERVKEELKRIYGKVVYIGSGDFADVFRVVDENGNIYAVKVPRLQDESHEEIFFNEVAKWKELNHRNIVKLVKPRVNPPHLVLEFVKGKSLEKLLKEKGKLDIFEACKIAFDVARALEYAHSKLILHCDLKPSNILIDESLGEAKVTDFGLAKSKSSSGIKGGTLAYLPPEAPKDYNEKSDVYQLGLIFYEMISGDLPDRKNPKPLGIEMLDDLIFRCLSEKPEDRPNAREFREVIYEFVKEKYGLSLKLTKDYGTMVRRLVELSLYAVKSGDLVTALSRLEEARDKAKSEVRGKIERVIEHIRVLYLNAPNKPEPNEDLIDEVRYLLKVVS